MEFTIREDLSIKYDDCDSIFIEFKRKERTLIRKIIIGVIYRPDYVDLDTFYSDLVRVFDVVNNEHKTCYIMGDFIIDLLKFSSNNKISNFVNLMYPNNFFPCIDRPTRITQHSATLLDNIITNDTSAKIRSGVFVTDITDHFLSLQLPVTQVPLTLTISSVSKGHKLGSLNLIILKVSKTVFL